MAELPKMESGYLSEVDFSENANIMPVDLTQLISPEFNQQIISKIVFNKNTTQMK